MFHRMASGSEVLNHPDIAAAGHAGDGQIAPVWRGDGSGSESPSLVAKGVAPTIKRRPCK